MRRLRQRVLAPSPPGSKVRRYTWRSERIIEEQQELIDAYRLRDAKWEAMWEAMRVFAAENDVVMLETMETLERVTVTPCGEDHDHD